MFRGCVECEGRKTLPRNGKNGATCTANECKTAYSLKRRDKADAAAAGKPADDAAPAVGDDLVQPLLLRDQDIVGRFYLLGPLPRTLSKN